MELVLQPYREANFHRHTPGRSCSSSNGMAYPQIEFLARLDAFSRCPAHRLSVRD